MGTKKKIYKTKKKPLRKSSVPVKKQSNPFKQKSNKRNTDKHVNKLPKVTKPEENVSDSDNGEDMLDMVDEEDISFLKNAISNKSYTIFNKIRCNSLENRKVKSKKRKLNDDEDDLENEYEDRADKETSKQVIRNLLPIKTKDKIIPQTMVKEEDQSDEEQEDEVDLEEEEEQNVEGNEDKEGLNFSFVNDDEFDPSVPVPMAELLAKRDQTLREKKLHIGTLSAGLLENPEEKITNFKTLLALLDDNTSEVFISLKKIVIISLLEVFKDLLPTYQINDHDSTSVKLKKDTRTLNKYEEGLLQHYRKYLQKLEKHVGLLFKKQGDNRKRSDADLIIGELALNAMCDLLVTHPYFNYADNIAQVVVPFLNNQRPTVREIVKNCCKTVFKEDKREQITLKILQVLNQHLKKHAHNVHVDMLDILLALKIKEVNLDQEKQHELKEKKLQSHRSNVLQLSKNERKRKKRLVQLEKELLETKAEENKQSKMRNLTDITKIVFGIYFRVLKSSTNTKVLGACLEGLAKFAHCINVDYFVDIVNVLDNLLKEEWLVQRERLNCVLTVFVILGGVGEALNIDPTRFYVTVYKNLLGIHASNTHDNYEIILKVLNEALLKRRKKITNKRSIGFVKRIATLSLQLLHNSSLSCLSIIKVMIQLNKAVDILLDLDTSIGDGRYVPDIDDAEYSNASSTSLFELVLLSNHYHPLVAKYATHIANGVPTTGNFTLASEFSKLSSEELYHKYDMSAMAFNPPVPVPDKKSSSSTKIIKHKSFADFEFRRSCYETAKKSRKPNTFFIEL